MHIAVIIERFDPARGGRERSTGEIAGRLARAGCAVEILCMQGRDAPPGVTLRPLAVRGPRAMRLARFIAAAGAAAAEYDLAHAMLPVPGARLYQIRSGSAPGMREGYIRQRGPLARLSWPMNALRRVLAQNERKVVADGECWLAPNSEMVAREIAHYYGRRERVRVIFNGVDVPECSDQQRLAWRRRQRSRWGAAPEAFVLALATMDFARKGGPELLRAWRAFRRRTGRRQDRLVLVGAARARSAEGVILSPPVAPIWPTYAGADATALPTWYDACSRVVLEATAFGCPCITSRYNGAAEALTGGAGVVIDDPGDADELAEAIEMLTDPDRRADMAELGRAKAPALSMARHVEQLLQLYEEIAR